MSYESSIKWENRRAQIDVAFIYVRNVMTIRYNAPIIRFYFCYFSLGMRYVFLTMDYELRTLRYQAKSKIL